MKEYLEKQRAKKQARAKELRAAIKGVKTREELDTLRSQLDTIIEEIAEIDTELTTLAEEAQVIEQRGVNTAGLYGATGGTEPEIRTLGDHFVEQVRDRLPNFRGVKNASVGADEFIIRANTDTIVTGGPLTGWASPLLTQVDPSVVQAFRRPTITELFGTGTITGNAITYFVEGAMEGDFAVVAEAGKKPQIYVADPTPKTDVLKKIAGFIKLSDEMFEDLPFIVTEINGRLMYALELKKEGHVLADLLGRSGLQVATSGSVDENADTLYEAISSVQEVTGMAADGIVINPGDYSKLRLSKDANGQYFGGGFFSGQYGTGGFAWEPPLWGVRTVVSPATAKGTAIVGAFNQGATVYGKGGVRVDATNSDNDDFIHNLVKVRAEERLALAVRYPAAFVKVSLASPVIEP